MGTKLNKLQKAIDALEAYATGGETLSSKVGRARIEAVQEALANVPDYPQITEIQAMIEKALLKVTNRERVVAESRIELAELQALFAKK